MHIDQLINDLRNLRNQIGTNAVVVLVPKHSDTEHVPAYPAKEVTLVGIRPAERTMMDTKFRISTLAENDVPTDEREPFIVAITGTNL